MKKLLFAAALFCMGSAAQASVGDTLFVSEPTYPLIINQENNIYFDLRIKPTKSGQELDKIVLNLSDAKYVKSVKVYYTGTKSFAWGNHYGRDFEKPTYAVLKDEQKNPSKMVTLDVDQKLFGDNNYFWVGVTMDPKTPIKELLEMKLSAATVDGEPVALSYKGEGEARRMGVSVRTAGDDEVAAYRIPGLVTSKKGTLVAVYDIRNNSSVDLQEDIQVGVSRSFDGGQTWKPMQVAMDMRGYGFLPDSQNGIGDPAILMDDKTGDLYIIALWAHGIGGQRNFFGSKKNAMLPEEQAAQVLISKSSDDGATWSEPVNITPQIKDPSWGVLLQGPGMGITMEDGTLVFAFQYVAADNVPKATIIYSKDRGQSWEIGAPARENTTEAQVAEIEPGVLMLNMRDNRRGSRAVMISKDMGKTWTDHHTTRSALIEPVCMASFVKINDKTFLFSNPADTKSRINMTIKGSTDTANSWNEGVLLDSGSGWGYSCITMIDDETVGIIYEGSQAHMTFQAIPLKDILK